MNDPGITPIRHMVTESLRDAILRREVPSIEPSSVVIHHPVAGDYSYSHHPHIVVFSGRLLAMWSSGVEREDRPGQRILWSTSTDGVLWSKPAVLAEPGPAPWRLTAGGWATDGDSVYAFINRSRHAHDKALHIGTTWYPPLNLDIMVAGSDLAWSGPQHVDSDFLTNESPRKTSRGVWLCAGLSARAESAVLRSCTGPGGPYSYYPVPRIPIPRPQESAGNWTAPIRPLGEPSWYERHDGVIVCFMRDDHASGNLFATESADDGMTWSRPEMTDIPDAKAKSAVVNLSDGRVVLVSNPILELRRRVLTVLVSDNGKVFDRGAILHEHKAIGDARPRGNAGWQYPSAVEHNGNLWLTCSETKHDIIVAQIPIRALP